MKHATKLIATIIVLIMILSVIAPMSLAVVEENNKVTLQNTVTEEQEKMENNMADNTVEGSNTVQEEKNTVEDSNTVSEEDQTSDNIVEKEEEENNTTEEEEVVVKDEPTQTIPENEENDILLDEQNTGKASVEYRGHAQYDGWQEWKRDGETAGNAYVGKKLEAIEIKLTNMPDGSSIVYQVHNTNNNTWQSVKKDGQDAGAAYVGNRMDLIKISLKNVSNYSVTYRVHSEYIGWQEWKTDGEVAGTEGKNIEGIEIKLIPKVVKNPSVEYRGHAQYDGWQKWKTDGETAGNAYVGKKLEAIEIKLTNMPDGSSIAYQVHNTNNNTWQSVKKDGQDAGAAYVGNRMDLIKISLKNVSNYSVTYRVHSEYIGWQEWKTDGEVAGTEGKNIEGIEIKLIPKVVKNPSVEYRGHAQYDGWQEWKRDGETAGNAYVGKKLEAIEIKLTNMPDGSSIAYQVHNTNNNTWQSVKKDGQDAGAAYVGNRMDLIKISLKNVSNYSITYRVHSEYIGWQEWKTDGEVAGTEGKNIEGIEIKLIPKVVKNLSVEYRGHAQYDGWQNWKRDGETAGNAYVGKKLEAIEIKLTNMPDGSSIAYQVHNTNNNTWQSVKKDGQDAGAAYIGNRMDLIKIQLKNIDDYSISYRVHSEYIGWQDWKEDGETAGTKGKNIEGIEIKITPKQEIGIVTLEKPQSRIVNQQIMTLEGWTLASGEGSYLGITIDNKLYNTDVNRKEREDVLEQYYTENVKEIIPVYGTQKMNQKPGFTASVDLRNLSAGKHTLLLTLYNQAGVVLSTVSKTFDYQKDVYFGIDVSHHQNEINWDLVKDYGINFAIIRIGYGRNDTQKDRYFERNYELTKRFKIPSGGYHYSYATDVEGARLEAQNCLNFIQTKTFELPIFYDVEDITQANLSKDTITDMCIAFCETLKEAGHTKVGIYASRSWLEEKIDMSRIPDDYNIWVAAYGVNDGDIPNSSYQYQGPHDIWQYTSVGNINGITGNVDFNLGYTKYW